MTLLQATGLAHERGGRNVLEALDLAASAGEFVAVIGPNGAGKSTLLSLLAGLEPPRHGQVLLGGRPLALWPAAQLAAKRAYLPQSPRCDWPLTVEALVALGLQPCGWEAPRREAALDDVLAALDLAPLRTRVATTLSGGEFARVMLARALVGDPDVLVADEPFAGLDPRHALDVARRLRELAVARGKLVIAALHDVGLALRHGSRVWALSTGRLVADRAADDVDAALLSQLFDVDAAIGPARGVDFL